MLCHRNINHFRKSLSLCSINIHPNGSSNLYLPINSFCSVSKLQKSPILPNEESIIEYIKKSYKSEQLSDHLSNLNLKKSGNKADKIQRLIDHFNSNTVKLHPKYRKSLS